MARLIVSLFFAITALAAIAWWWLFTLPFSHRTLLKLTQGMNQAQVIATIGRPGFTNSAGSQMHWVYQRPFSIVHLDVFFDANGRYTQHLVD